MDSTKIQVFSYVLLKSYGNKDLCNPKVFLILNLRLIFSTTFLTLTCCSLTSGVLGILYPLLMAAMLGVGDGVFNTQLNALLGILFKNDMVPYPINPIYIRDAHFLFGVSFPLLINLPAYHQRCFFCVSRLVKDLACLPKLQGRRY